VVSPEGVTLLKDTVRGVLSAESSMTSVVRAGGLSIFTLVMLETGPLTVCVPLPLNPPDPPPLTVMVSLLSLKVMVLPSVMVRVVELPST
jgi:hypothetical protein